MHPTRRRRWALLAAASTIYGAGCATGRPLAPKTMPGNPAAVRAASVSGATPIAAGPSSLEDYIGAIRKVSQAARPTDRPETFETTNPALAAALNALKAAPTALQEDRVADLYRRAGVLDTAYDHYTSALRLDPRDATAFDGRARIWRDWGFPSFGLGDAYRAVYFAPRSAAARSTLGTLLQAIGELGAARQQYSQALVLEPGAPFALNNLCYAAVVGGSASAIDRCTQAVATAPHAPIVRHNLALAYAAAGQLDEARREFLRADPADASYNMGIVCLATGRYAQAAEEFTAAAGASPGHQAARLLADKARRLAAAHDEPDHHRD
jgi:Flp pilus assembly protein TadD